MAVRSPGLGLQIIAELDNGQSELALRREKTPSVWSAFSGIVSILVGRLGTPREMYACAE